jgi:hypothetical protein
VKRCTCHSTISRPWSFANAHLPSRVVQCELLDGHDGEHRFDLRRRLDELTDREIESMSDEELEAMERLDAT